MLVHEDERPLGAAGNQVSSAALTRTAHHGLLQQRPVQWEQPGEQIVGMAAFSHTSAGFQSGLWGGRRHLRGTFFHEDGILTKWKKKYCRRC